MTDETITGDSKKREYNEVSYTNESGDFQAIRWKAVGSAGEILETGITIRQGERGIVKWTSKKHGQNDNEAVRDLIVALDMLVNDTDFDKRT